MRPRIFITSLASAVLVATAAVAGAQGSAAPDPLFRLTSRVRVQVEAIRDSAHALGLPERPIVLKALEADAKKRDPIKATQDLLASMRTAQKALDTKVEDQILAGVDALNGGLSVEDLALFQSAARTRSPVMALTHLTSLVAELGVPRASAVATFAKLWQSGTPDAELEGLWRSTKADIISGANPGQAFTNQVNRLPRRGGPPEDPEKTK